MQKIIQKPKNWQDFETLCMKLWSEEFQSNFKQNGRNGQQQNGVDIYGVPKGKTEYWGIQCKLKVDSQKISVEEIETEIHNAENFEPLLEYFIIATTSPKDAKVEEWVRITNRTRLKQKKFGIELYCWEDIETLLNQNSLTHTWYLQNLDVLSRHSVEVTFQNEQETLVINPKFLKTIERRRFTKKSELMLLAEQSRVMAQFGNDLERLTKIIGSAAFGGVPKKNLAWCNLDVVFKNCGSSAIQNWELRFYIDEKYGRFYEYEEGRNLCYIPEKKRWKYVWDHEVLYHDPDYRTFVQKDHHSFSFPLKPSPGIDVIPIRWQLLAKDFDDNGILQVQVEPEIIKREEIIEVDSLAEEGIKELALKDYCTNYEYEN